MRNARSNLAEKCKVANSFTESLINFMVASSTKDGAALNILGFSPSTVYSTHPFAVIIDDEPTILSLDDGSSDGGSDSYVEFDISILANPNCPMREIVNDCMNLESLTIPPDVPRRVQLPLLILITPLSYTKSTSISGVIVSIPGIGNGFVFSMYVFSLN